MAAIDHGCHNGANEVKMISSYCTLKSDRQCSPCYRIINYHINCYGQ